MAKLVLPFQHLGVVISIGALISVLGVPTVMHNDIGFAIGTCKLKRGIEASLNDRDMAFLIAGNISFTLVRLPC